MMDKTEDAEQQQEPELDMPDLIRAKSDERIIEMIWFGGVSRVLLD